MKKLKRKSVITTMDDGKTQFSDLPSCLVIDILLRLPISTLLTCICVCKDWIRLLRDPYFIKLHLAASPVHILNRHIGKDGIFQFGQLMEDGYTGDLEVKILNLPTKVDFLTLLNLPPSTGIYDYGCINSCNGLLCLVDPSHRPVPFARSVCVCNPILGEWVSISTPVRKYEPGKYKVDTTAMALVFSAKNNQYKLLHGFKTEKDYGFEIYTLGGARQWRSIDETLGCRPWKTYSFREGRPTIFLHGSLHWICSGIIQPFLCCFDVDDEKFRRLSLPSYSNHEEKFFFHVYPQLGVINGCLCLLTFVGYTDNTHTDDVNIWVMKEYGVEKSWGKMLNINVSRLSQPYLLFSQNEEEILIYDYTESLVSYNLKTNMRRYWQQPGCREKSYYFHFRVPYKPSFISLQDVAKGEEVMLSRTMQVIQ